MSREVLSKVFDLPRVYDCPIILENLLEEYRRLDTTYAGWRLPFHLLNPDVPLEIEESLTFHVNLFKDYFKYTYYSVGQVLGLNTLDFMRIESMVIAAYIQSQKVREFDYATFVVEQLVLGLTAIQRDFAKIHFSHYSLLMHMVLFYGHEMGL